MLKYFYVITVNFLSRPSCNTFMDYQEAAVY